MIKKIGLIFKHIFDFVTALILSTIALPVLLIAIIAIKIVSPEDSPIFKQVRVGYKNKPFTIYKLRTMTNEKGEDGEFLSDEIRTKKWGKIIRAMNIDELTQILNILAFQMSFIGPRPLLSKEMCVMTNEQQELRQSVFPGISGWEAVNEEKTSTRTEMAEYDLFYVKNWSLWFDTKIFFKTILIVFLKLRPDDSLRAPKMPEEISQEVPEEVGKR